MTIYIAALLVCAALLGVWRRALRQQRSQVDAAGLTALWEHQRVLLALGREAATAVTGGSDRLNRIRRDELLDSRRAALPHLHLVSREVRRVLLDPAIADLADPRRPLVDVAHDYLALAEALRADLEPAIDGPAGGAHLLVADLDVAPRAR